MPKQQSDVLRELVKSMSKAEKRSFRLMVNVQNRKEEKLFVSLFDFIDSNKTYDDDALIKKYPQIKKAQIPNIKSNLYKHLLQNLRHLHRNEMADIGIREMLDHARIMHSKGLYRTSLDILEKAKKAAIEIDDSALAFAAIDLERKIENHYVTGSMAEKANVIKEQSNEIIKHLKTNNDLANLSLLLYGLYLKYGYVKDKRDHEFVKTFFDSHLPLVSVDQLSFYEKVYYYQSFVWYSHMTQDFVNYFKYAQKWVEVFDGQTQMIRQDYALYFKGLHNVLNSLYMANKQAKFESAMDQFLSLENAILSDGNYSDEANYMLFKYTHLLNKIILIADYDTGVNQISGLTEILKYNKYNWDINRIMVFYYKIACIYFGADDYNKALDYLNKITNYPVTGLRLDIQSFARILSLISHYELGNETLVKYQVMSVYRFLSKLEDLQSVQKEIFTFLRRTPKMGRNDIKTEFIKLRDALNKYTKDPYERRPFLYLDIIAWLDSKIEKKRIQEIIRARKQNVL